jgi:DNA-binding FrmR family transcriptional regulator
MPGYEMSKGELLQRLRRIEGQVRGISHMVEADRYCIDILTQISAAERALQGVAVGLLNDHLGHCFVDAARASDAEARQKVSEATAAIQRLLRS